MDAGPLAQATPEHQGPPTPTSSGPPPVWAAPCPWAVALPPNDCLGQPPLVGQGFGWAVVFGLGEGLAPNKPTNHATGHTTTKLATQRTTQPTGYTSPTPMGFWSLFVWLGGA